MPKEDFHKQLYEAITNDLRDCARDYFDKQIAVYEGAKNEPEMADVAKSGITREFKLQLIVDHAIKLAIEVSRDVGGFNRARRTKAHADLLQAIRQAGQI